MKRIALVSLVAVAALAFTGCTATTDGRTGLRGELCAFGYCLAPQAMSAGAVAVPQTAVVSGAVVAPATILSQPAVATAPMVAASTAACAPAYAPAPPAPNYPPNFSIAPYPQLSK